jgi:two-component sensor histidine kinase
LKDNGVGPDNSESTGTGIGSTLINSLVTQIDGTYKIENDDGAKVTIKFKD